MIIRPLLALGLLLYSTPSFATKGPQQTSLVPVEKASLTQDAEEKKYKFSIVSDSSTKNKTVLFGVHNLSDHESKHLVAMTSTPTKLGDIIEKRGAVGVYSSVSGEHPSYGIFSKSVGDIPQAIDTKTGNEYKFTQKGVSITKNNNGKICKYTIPYSYKNTDEVIYDMGNELPSCLKHDKNHPRRIMITRKEQKKPKVN